MNGKERLRGCVFASAGCAASILVLLVLGVVVLRTMFVAHRQTTINMEPTLARGDRVVARRARAIRRRDLVTFVMPADGGLAIKRVVGLPGETIELRDGAAVIDGTPLDANPRRVSPECGNLSRAGWRG